MHHFLYFLAAMVLLAGLLYIAGDVGHSPQQVVTASGQMDQLISGSDSGSCASCKWY